SRTSSRATVLAAEAGASRPASTTRAKYARFSRRVKSPYTDGACVVYATRRRSSGEPAGTPSTRTLPPATIWTPTSARSSVVFPEPLGPSRPVTVAASTESVSRGKTTLPPRTTRRSSTSIAGTALLAPGGARDERCHVPDLRRRELCLERRHSAFAARHPSHDERERRLHLIQVRPDVSVRTGRVQGVTAAATGRREHALAANRRRRQDRRGGRRPRDH